jgi:hypothetical protein
MFSFSLKRSVMNVSFSRNSLLFLMVFFNQSSLAMNTQLAVVTAQSKELDALHHRVQKETQFFLGAVYFKDHETIEAVLKNSLIRTHSYYFNSNAYGGLSAYPLARDNKDDKTLILLKKYKYADFECLTIYDEKKMPTELMISCYARNMDNIKKIIDTCPPHSYNRYEIEDCLTLAAERKDVECLTVLLACESIRKIIDYYYFTNLLNKISRKKEMEDVVKTLLESACYRFYQNPFNEKNPYDAIVEKYLVKK